MSKIRMLSIVAATYFVTLANGCSICCTPYLDDYVAFGSKHPRMDMKNGRVGSVFSDPQLIGTTAHPGANRLPDGSAIELGSEIQIEPAGFVWDESSDSDSVQ
ncbi:MAG: hypothetical protein ABL921_15490 [Pirellula sp.]